MSLLESASAASRRRSRAAACLQSPQDDANANNNAVEPQDDANTNNNAVEPKDDVNANNEAVKIEDSANVNDDAVSPKDAASVSIILPRQSQTLRMHVVLHQPPSTPPSPMPTRPAGTLEIPSR